ncbi:MAG: nucleoside triphosphate pyrophosphohydrolase, partial [Pseudomonadales bacterium]|nr:nucleoside triphosphate pyrophosphohydrolase [Pseudomonadales bacterium]
EAIKRDERRARCQNGLFDDIPLALPAMLRARKLQKRAAGIGLDWPDAQGALLSLKRELAEFEAELPAAASTSPASADASALDRLTAELGDLLFSCVNVARKLDINPEQALRGANEKFRQRAVCVEQSLAQLGYTGDSGRELPGAEHIDRLWQAAKQQE